MNTPYRCERYVFKIVRKRNHYGTFNGEDADHYVAKASQQLRSKMKNLIWEGQNSNLPPPNN